jgi:hypothetical protein
MPLVRAVRALSPARAAANPQPGSYVALRDQPLLLGLLLLFWTWCHDAEDAAAEISSDERLGLQLPRNPEKREAWLVCTPSAVGATAHEEKQNRDLAFVQIALCTDGSLYQTSALRPPKARAIPDTRESADDTVVRRYGLELDARLLLELAAREVPEGSVAGSGWKAFQAALDHVVDRPWLWLPDYRPSYRDRTRGMTA